MQVEESPPASSTATLVAQIDRGPDFVRPDAQATYRSPHASLVHEGGYYKCTAVFFFL